MIKNKLFIFKKNCQMANNYKQAGNNMTVVLAAAAVSGVPFLVGSKLVMPLQSGGIGDTIEVSLVGVWEVVKATGSAWTQGEAIYWDDTAKKVTDVSTANTLIGFAFADAASGDTVGIVKLNQA